jgi:hypothetical protein
MALQKEIWINDIQENLFKGQEFMSSSVDHSAFVDNAIVHLPQAGANPAVETNRSVFPATISERTDSEKTYALRNYSTDPIRLRNLDEIQTSYAKRSSILGQHTELLNETIGDNVCFDWGIATGARVLRTSGTAIVDALAPSATGARKVVTRADIRNLAKVLDKDNVAMAGRMLLMQTDLYYQWLAVCY